MMKIKDIVMGFLSGYVFGFGVIILYIICKAFITLHIGIDSVDFIWKDYTLVRSLIIAGVIGVMFAWQIKYDGVESHDAVHAVSGKLCPCGHIHKPSSNGNGLRTYCVEGSNCNSDKCKEFVKHAVRETGVKNG